jgi:beta-lactamase regulating signal transducer with metallopeptidase domain
MPEVLLDHPWLADLLWQSSFWLLVGLLLHRRLQRPAHAHALLSGCMLAAVLTPVLSSVLRAQGCGWLAPLPAALRSPSGLPEDWIFSPNHRLEETLWVPGFCLLWALLSLWLIARLARSWVRGRRMLSAAFPATERWRTLSARAAQQLGLQEAPELWFSPSVTCPNIWCWSKPARILLPLSMARKPVCAGLPAILCHELAHWKRRDHWTALLGEVLLCLLPWQPLMWWLRRRQNALSEQAADRWVLAAGESPARFAQSLLRMLPQQVATPTLAAAGRRADLSQRIRFLLAAPPEPPQTTGPFRWMGSVALVFCITTVAMAQRRTHELRDPRFESHGPPLLSAAQQALPLSTYPTALDFDVVPPRGTATQPLWLLNLGSETVWISAVRAGCGCTSIHGFEPTALAPGDWLALQITMQAPAAEQEVRERYVKIHADGYPTLKVPLTIASGPASP